MSEKMIRRLMFLIAGFTPPVVYLGLGNIAMKTKTLYNKQSTDLK